MADPWKTILLVEDEAIIALNEAEQLKEYGYSVIRAATGEKAIELVESDPGSIGIILMDIDLGRGMDGTEAAQKILCRYDIPILFLSSHIERGIVEKTEGITNYGYVVKSSSFTVLDASIKMALKLFDARKRINAINMDFEAANEELRMSLENLQSANGKLAKSEEKFSKAFDLNPDSININRLSDGVYININEGFTQITGYAREEVIGRSSLPGGLGIWVREEDRERLVRGLRESGEVANLEAEFRRKDGSATIGLMSARIIDIDGEACILSITRDMGARRKVEQSLRESEERYKSIIAVSGIGAWEYHRDSGFLWCSPEYFTMLGRDPADYRVDGNLSLEKAWIELLHPDDREKSSLLFSDYLSSGSTGQYENQSRMKHEDGRWIWILSRARTLPDRDGRPSDVTLGVHIDITERVLSEERIRSLLREKELILKEVHHRVKNNLNTTASLLSIQASEQADPASADILMKAAGRVESMMLLYGKLYNSSSAQELSLNDYLSSLIPEVVGIFPNSSTVKTRTDIPEIRMGAAILSTLGIIVNELITNAMKYAFVGRPGGTIAMSVSKSGGRISLVFEDDGIGMPESADVENPKGFGMQLVEMLVEQLNGTMKVERRPGMKYVIEFEAQER